MIDIRKVIYCSATRAATAISQLLRSQVGKRGFVAAAGQLDGYTTSFVDVKSDADLTELLRGLPADARPSPHWGYVFAAGCSGASPDREKSIGPGEAFYVQPGHTSAADAGTSVVIFSPTEVMPEVEAHMMRRARERAPASQ